MTSTHNPGLAVENTRSPKLQSLLPIRLPR